jgi:hypothetical protein
MSDGVQRGEATVSRSVRDCLPICLPSMTRHCTFQRTPADDVTAYLAPRPPGGRQWHGSARPRLGVALSIRDPARVRRNLRPFHLGGVRAVRSWSVSCCSYRRALRQGCRPARASGKAWGGLCQLPQPPSAPPERHVERRVSSTSTPPHRAEAESSIRMIFS